MSIRYISGVEQCCEWPCCWVPYQGLWPETIHAGICSFTTSCILSGKLVHFWSKMGTFLIENWWRWSHKNVWLSQGCYRRWSNTPSLLLFLLCQPTTRCKSNPTQYQAKPNHRKPKFHTTTLDQIFSAVLSPSKPGWTRSRRLKRHQITSLEFSFSS